MIFDRLENAGLYDGVSRKIMSALEYLKANSLFELEPGNYEIPGADKEDMFLMIQEYQTRPIQDAFWEAHRRHIDVQYMMLGSEKMGYAHLENLQISQEYTEEKDFMVLEGHGDFITVHSGSFVVFFPRDAHMPCLAADVPGTVKKAVIKVRI